MSKDLQFLTPTRRHSRVQEISEISRALKVLAKDLNVPVTALSQLNRAVEHREKKIPQLSDLRESGAIEQDADLIISIYRAGANKSQENETATDAPEDNTAELIVAKQRNGPTGKVKLVFHGRARQPGDA